MKAKHEIVYSIDVNRLELWFCKKCNKQLELDLRIKKNRDTHDRIINGLNHNDLEPEWAKTHLCYGHFMFAGADPIIVEKVVPTAYGAAYDRWNKTQQSKPLGERSVVCCIKLKHPPYTIYQGTSSTGRDEIITNERLVKILHSVEKREEWSKFACAEVQAAQHLFDANPDIHAKDVEFDAVDVHGAPKPPCQNCKQWINKF